MRVLFIRTTVSFHRQLFISGARTPAVHRPSDGRGCPRFFSLRVEVSVRFSFFGGKITETEKDY